jgi:hypothetical protein
VDADGHGRTITRENLRSATERLRVLAKTRKPTTDPERATLPQVVRLLRSEIAVAFKQGYEVEDILGAMAEFGIHIEAKAFKRYWRRAKQSRAQPTKTRAMSAQATSHSVNGTANGTVEAGVSPSVKMARSNSETRYAS